MKLLAYSPRGAHAGTLLIRLMIGAVFLSEGLQKFIYPDERGAGRFERIGFPEPDFWGYFVGSFETICGALILAGLLTRFAAVPVLVIMVAAIVTTKLPILIGEGFGPFGVRELSQYGFWSMAHEMRTDWAMLLGSIYLILAGGGPLSADGLINRRSARRTSSDSTSSLPPNGG